VQTLAPISHKKFTQAE